MIWVIVPIIGILTPFCYGAYVKWVKLQKMRMNAPITDDHVARLLEAEDAIESAQRRIENLESIVVSRLLEDPSEKETVNIETPEMIAQSASK